MRPWNGYGSRSNPSRPPIEIERRTIEGDALVGAGDRHDRRVTPVSIRSALESFSAEWQPRRLSTVNDHDVKIVRISGEFVWHRHPDSDELFLVLNGQLTVDLRTGGTESAVVLGPDGIFVVPSGVEHRPRAEPGTVVVLIEKVGTVNTGDVGGERTAEVREVI
jgi:mannose-6-phosphate isomerase-like protein (cupin superfamily)